MAKARPWLINAIRRHPESINQPNALGQTALHLSVFWPEGLQYLLDAGADIDAGDHDGITPVFYAAIHLLPKPLIVLAGRACLLHMTRHRPSEARRREGLSLLQCVLQEWGLVRRDKTEATFDAIIKVVVERRHNLKVLAQSSLDAKAVERLQLSNEAVLDRNASTAISMMGEKIDVPAWLAHLTWEHSTVYHIEFVTLQWLQRLWDAGFREIDEPDEWGHSPLMVHRVRDRYRNIDYWEAQSWFVTNGADLYRRQKYVFSKRRIEDYNKTSSTTAWHYLAYQLGEYNMGGSVQRFFPDLEPFSEQARHLILYVLTESPSDSCDCPCSAKGCRASTMMGKNFTRWALCLQVSQELAQFLNIDQPSLAWLRGEMIRFNTFEKLDLRHTCCQMDYAEGPQRFVICEPYDEDEIHEIHEEQAEQIEKLEALLIEFDNKYEESGSTFSDFMGGYWLDRMKEVLSEEGPVDHEALEDMGIVLRKKEKSSPSASDDDE